MELMKANKLPVPAQIAQSYLGGILALVCGAAMLKGKNWARLLYVVWEIIGFGISAATTSTKMALIPGLAIAVIIVLILFVPSSNAYFKGQNGSNAQGA